jgi:hypothetical protein
MQRQDDYHITRTGMLLFIAQLLSLADAVIRIVAQCRTIDDRLLHSFAKSELAMLIVLSGIVSNTDTRGTTPGLNDIIDLDEPPDRHAELLRIGASLQQIAMALAMILAMNPRAFQGPATPLSIPGPPLFTVIPGPRSGTRNPEMGRSRSGSKVDDTGPARNSSPFHLWIPGSAAPPRNDAISGRPRPALGGNLAQPSPSHGPKGLICVGENAPRSIALVQIIHRRNFVPRVRPI